MKNWKTTLAGTIFGVLSIVQPFTTVSVSSKISAAQTIMLALGLVAAKDASTHSTTDEVRQATQKADVGSTN